jgi:hypothetical protein
MVIGDHGLARGAPLKLYSPKEGDKIRE